MFDQWRIWAGEIAEYISKFVDFPKIDMPDFSGRDDRNLSEIDELATACRRAWGLGDGPIANVVALLESRGLVMVRLKSNLENIDAFSCWQDRRPSIFLDEENCPAVRSRFNACHELAHLLLHRHITTADIEQPDVLRRIEREANRFASAFLMPEATFRAEIYGASIRHFVELKRRWKVSIAAMAYRCKDLGVFDEDQHIRFRKQLSYHGYTKVEPLDPELVNEESTMLRKAMELLVRSGVRSATQILTDLKISSPILSRICGLPADFFTPSESKPIEFPIHLRARVEPD